MAEGRPAGTLYDLGYARYEGRRLGRANAVRTLVVFSLRSAFGLGRGERAKVVPGIVAALILIPVFLQVSVAAATGRGSLINYAGYLQFVGFFLAIFAASQAPELVVTDRQHGVLALYFARALRPADYAAAKLVAFVGALLVLTLGPALLLFLGKVFVSPTPWRAFVDGWTTLGPIVGGATLTACYVGVVALALSAYATRRGYGSAAVIAFFLLLPAASGIAQGIATGDARRYAVLGNPFLVIVGFTNWLFDVQARRRSFVARAALPGQLYLYVMLGTCVLAVAAFLWRYRRATT